ncbi:MAG: hypothetical protein WC479_10895 [Candidatus Izemoplasmatales bacterium]|jgi:hypothetical protein|nr:hypothetical protein [Candidatus Izemoplasmatales bacterium]MDD3864848.1 hypothetical protein [Candidatus Izemoplasmatales bacterium]
MEIRNHTMYDKELLIKYNKYYLVDFIKKNFSIIAVFAIGFAIYMFAIGDWQYGVFLIGFVIVYLALTIIIQRVTSNRAVKKSPLVEHPIMQNYTFTDEFIQVEGVRPRTIKYHDVIKIHMNTDFLIITDVERKTIVIDMGKFDTYNDAAKLKEFLNLKFKKHFK